MAGEYQEVKTVAVTRWHGSPFTASAGSTRSQPADNPPAPASAVIIAQSMREQKHHEHRKNQSRHS